jgi:hypothetical protein
LQTNNAEKSLEFNRDFRIKHYAGDVTYKVPGFMDKNRDSLFQDFKRLLYNSRNTFLQNMWPEGAQCVTNVTKRPITAGTSFKNSIIELVKKLGSKVFNKVFENAVITYDCFRSRITFAASNRMKRNRQRFSMTRDASTKSCTSVFWRMFVFAEQVLPSECSSLASCSG